MNPEWRNRYELAVEAAQQAGRIALGYFDGDLTVDTKKDLSPVTIADREAEAFLRKRLLSAFPQDAFLGEESGDQAGTSGFRWIIDPVDGTRNFVRGVPLWATLVGLENKGELIAGVAYLPAVNQTFPPTNASPWGPFKGPVSMSGSAFCPTRSITESAW